MNSKVKAKPKVSLEEYLDFTESLNGDDLTLNYLNQILSMHGFIKLHNTPKKVLVDAVNTIDLMVPFRSTLKENICSNVFLMLEDVIEDLSTLQWQECSVKSMETLRSGKENLTDDDLRLKFASSTVSKNANYSKLKGKGKFKKSNIIPSSSLTVGENAGSKRKRKLRNAPKAGILAAAPVHTPSSSFLSLGSY